MRVDCTFKLRTVMVVTFVILHTEKAEKRLDLPTCRQARPKSAGMESYVIA